jgi:hypothetical protein
VHPVDPSHGRKRRLSSGCWIDLNQAQDNARRPATSGFAGDMAGAPCRPAARTTGPMNLPPANRLVLDSQSEPILLKRMDGKIMGRKERWMILIGAGDSA